MEIATESGTADVAQKLLEYFIEINSPQCFAACLYTCYDLIKPDDVLFLAWRNNYIEYVMPYLAQVLREYTDKVDTLVEENESFGNFPDEPNHFPTNMPGVPPNMSPNMSSVPPNMGGVSPNFGMNPVINSGTPNFWN
jgi:hypothetical protein